MTRSGAKPENNKLTAIEIAHALLRQSRELFTSLRPVWVVVAKGKPPEPPDFSSMTTFAYNLSSQVQNDIVAKDDLAERVRTYRRWVIILDECYRKGDMHCAQAILIGINAASVQRLKITKIMAHENMSPRINERFKIISDKLSHDNHTGINDNNRTIVPAIRAFKNAYVRVRNECQDSIENKSTPETAAKWETIGRVAKDRLMDFPVYLVSRQAKAKVNPMRSSQDADEYVRNLGLSLISTPVSEENLLKRSKTLEPTIMRGNHLVDVNKADILKFFFAQTATGGLKPLVNSILKDKSALAKVRLDEISNPSFIRELNRLLVQPSPNKKELIGLLAGAGITLDSHLSNSNYSKVCEQARYHKLLTSEPLKELLGNQYLKGRAGIFERTNTGYKIQQLNDFFIQKSPKELVHVQTHIVELLNNLGLKVKETKHGGDGFVSLGEVQAAWRNVYENRGERNLQPRRPGE